MTITKQIQNVTPSKAARERARTLIEAKTAILCGGDFLPVTEVAKFVAFSSIKMSVQLNKWKRNREIFAIELGRKDYLPLYGLNAGGHRRF